MSKNKNSISKSIARRIDPLTKIFSEENFNENNKNIEPKKNGSEFEKNFSMNKMKKYYLNEEDNDIYQNPGNYSNETSLNDEESLEKIFEELSEYNIFSLARHGQHEILECLLIKGISPDSRDLDGNTILILGAQNGDKRLIKIALRYGAQINMKNCNGNTALHYSMEYSYLDIVNYLIKKGANPNIENIKGFKANEGISKRIKNNMNNKNNSNVLLNLSKNSKNYSKNGFFKFNAKNINLSLIGNKNFSHLNDLSYDQYKKGDNYDKKPKII